MRMYIILNWLELELQPSVRDVCELHMSRDDDHPGFVPSGLWGWVIENILVITLLAATAVAVVLVVFKEQIFGG